MKTDSKYSAFSLIELLVVCSIIAIIIGFTIPAATTLIKGSQLTQGSQLLSDQIALARQLALSKNRSVEVRFYKFGDIESPGEEKDKPETGKYRAFQCFEVLESGAMVPLNKIQRLPITVILNESPKLSTLIGRTDASGKAVEPRTPDATAPELPREVKKEYLYVAFRFLPDGSTDLSPTGNWFVTLHSINDPQANNPEADKPPANFFTLQIDPVSGSTKSYRPGAS